MATAALTSVPLRTRTLSWRGRTTARVAGVLVARCRSGARHNHPEVRQLMSGQAWAPRPWRTGRTSVGAQAPLRDPSQRYRRDHWQ
jgi:hypothetical protein